ncbi:hypothetical protein [Archangium lipolyticum]|uniref:hypothetical protein n=1 Tax=Archangium lipolyticum TaxID=2970465 RepID=UPI002149C4BC|nr:hypothetical protein [Archangium lipolyticum]
MSCTTQQSEVTALRNRRNEQLKLLESLPHNAGYEAASAELDRIEADLAEAEAALKLCQDQEAQAANPVPKPVSAKVDKIQCHDVSKEVGHDEPYLLIATFDMTDAVNLGVVGVTFPDINVLKIGPWIGVDAGETHYTSHLSSANRPNFWDLDSGPRPIAHPQDVIFLVAMCENDGSSPDAIRGRVRTDLLAARAPNTNRSYSAYVTAMISNMTGSIETNRLLGLDPLNPNEDDLVETVKHLALTAADIDRLNKDLLPVVKTLRFTQRRGDGNVTNDYTVTFSFTV